MRRSLMIVGARPAVQPTQWTLRVSVLDRCQYRCAYCRPGAISPFVAPQARLSPDDYAQLSPLFARQGVTKVRFTGGEPLLRADLSDVLRAFRAGLPNADLAVTTNGQHLAQKLKPLVAAGLTRATVHVDSLRPDRYRLLMGNGNVARVLDSVLEARSHLREIKLNVVVQRGQNDDELADFIAWSRATQVEVRFIELMNTGSAAEYTRQTFFSGREIVAAVGAAAGAHPLPRIHPSDPAARFRTDDGVVFGVIASDTEPFCANCNRMRLSAEGRLLGCLYQAHGIDLKPALQVKDTTALSEAVRTAFGNKRSHHPSTQRPRALFSMAQTGG